MFVSVDYTSEITFVELHERATTAICAQQGGSYPTRMTHVSIPAGVVTMKPSLDAHSILATRLLQCWENPMPSLKRLFVPDPTSFPEAVRKPTNLPMEDTSNFPGTAANVRGLVYIGSLAVWS